MSRPVDVTVDAPEAPRAVAHRLIDVAVLSLAVVLALVPLVPVFGVATAAPAIGGGAVIGVLVAGLGAARRWPVIVRIAVALVLFVALAGPLALPNTTTGGVVPSRQTFIDLGTGIVASWKQILTLEPPIGHIGAALVAPYFLATFAVLTVGIVAVGRTTAIRLLASVLVPVLVLVLAILLGTVATFAVVVGVVLTALLLVWTAWRRGRWRPRRGYSLAVLALVSLGGGAVLAPVVAGDTPRFVLRSVIVPPFDPREHGSPLSAYRAFLKDSRETELISVTDLPADGLLRLAVMDGYDGVVWNVLGNGEASSGAFRQVGDTIPTSTTGAEARIGVTIAGLDGPWLPTVGATTGIAFSGEGADEARRGFRYNDATGTAVLSEGVTPGLEYILDAVVPAAVTDDEIGDAAVGGTVLPAQDVPEIVSSRAAEITANATTPAAKARALETYLHDNGYFSHGLGEEHPSLPGHSAYRMGKLLGEDMMIGDAEQYASVMALMAIEAGLPARVVIGFAPTPDQRAAGTLSLTGDDVQAWTEINFEGIGWVPYFPTPPESQTPETAEVPEEPEPNPQVVQPPPGPQDPVVPPKEDVDDPSLKTNEDRPEEVRDYTGLIIAATAVTVPLLLLLVPIGIIVALKARRRRRRRSAPTVEEQISGGWDEVLDTAKDFGTALPVDATRRETARVLTLAFPQVPCDLLAEYADEAVFAALSLPEDVAVEYWKAVDTSLGSMRVHGSWWTRLRGRVSLASLRHGGPGPVRRAGGAIRGRLRRS